MEELRIQKQQEEDRLRFEEERRRNEERQILEQRKLETLKKALEDAERKARQEKEKRFSNYRQNSNNNTHNIKTPTPNDKNIVKDSSVQKDNVCDIPSSVKNSPTKTNRTYDVHSASNQNNNNSIKDNNSQHTTEFNSPRSIATGNLNFYIQNVPSLSLTDNQFSIVPIGINNDLIQAQQNGLQLAVLVPQNINNSLYNISLNSINSSQDPIESSTKVLTPRKYRNVKYKNVSTQTDLNLLQYSVNNANETENLNRSFSKDYQNIDENAPQDSHYNMRKDRRYRSEERFKKDIENRPKWGVNRPAAQYKKQSEKDPFYSQKRKIRQKHRPQPRQYLSQSSDDSRSPSPPLRLDKNPEINEKTRNSLSQSYWRNKRSNQELLKSNNEISEDNINMQIDSNLVDQLTGEITDNGKTNFNIKSPTKRVTLSQKFINDKYGNRKLWSDENVTERHIKTNHLDTENRKKIIEQLNSAKRNFLERFDNQ